MQMTIPYKMSWLLKAVIDSHMQTQLHTTLSYYHHLLTSFIYPLPCIWSFIQIEAGLGLSESFYHVAISAFSVGQLLGAMTASIIFSRMPLWYNTMAALLCHITGFVVYAMATSGWMMIVARILSGMFIGLEVVLSLAYFGVSYLHYLEVLGPEERTKEEGKTTRVKDTLFALYAVSENMGNLIGPGLSNACPWYIEQFHNIKC